MIGVIPEHSIHKISMAMKRIIILLLLALVPISYAETFQVPKSDFVLLMTDFSKQTASATELGIKSVKDPEAKKLLLSYLDAVYKIEDRLEKLEKKNAIIPKRFRNSFYHFQDQINIAVWNNIKSDPAVRSMYLERYKATKGACYSDYIRSSDNWTQAAVELLELNSDMAYDIFKLMYNRIQSPKTGTILMNKAFLGQIKKYVSSNSPLKVEFKPALQILVAPRSDFEFEGISESDFRSEGLQILIEYISRSLNPKEPSKKDFYAFGVGDNEFMDKDTVINVRYIPWYRYVKLYLEKLPGLSLEGLQEFTPADPGFARTTILGLRAKNGDTSVKEELKADIQQIEDPSIRAIFLKWFGGIAGTEDAAFIRSISDKDETYNLDEEDRNMFMESYPGQPYREEISPGKEAAEAILKKIGG